MLSVTVTLLELRSLFGAKTLGLDIEYRSGVRVCLLGGGGGVLIVPCLSGVVAAAVCGEGWR